MARVDRRELAAVFAGGAVGTLSRAGLSRADTSAAAHFPWVTFSVNVAGALLLGYLVTRLTERRAPSRYLRPLLATGFCGAFTTFSTMQLELLGMFDAQRWGLASAYIGASLVLGYAAVVLGTVIARRAPGAAA